MTPITISGKIVKDLKKCAPLALTMARNWFSVKGLKLNTSTTIVSFQNVKDIKLLVYFRNYYYKYGLI